MNELRVRDWTARDQPGGIFCAPSCGCGCLRIDYDQAVSAGAALAAQLGAGWEPNVWENGGWNYCASKGVARVTVNHVLPYRGRPREVEGYTGWVNSSACGQTIVRAGDPVEAMGLAMQEARTKALRFSAELDEVSA